MVCVRMIFFVGMGNSLKKNLKSGRKLMDATEYEQALARFDRCIELNPGSAEAYNNKGVALKNLKRFEEALVCYDKCIELDPTNIDAFYNKGLNLYSLHRFEECLECYDQCTKLNPDDYDAYNGKGYALKNLNRSDEALYCFDNCIELNPNHVEAYNGKGLVLYNLSRFEESLECFNKCIEISPDYLFAYNNKGLVFNRLNRNDEVASCFEKCLELDRDFLWKCNQPKIHLMIGGEDFTQIVSLFVRSLDLSEEKATRYSLQLFNEGIYTVNILNTCRRSKLLDSDHFVQMKFPEPIQTFLCAPPNDPVVNLSHFQDLNQWLRDSLGVRCEILLDAILVKLTSNKDYYNLKLLRLNKELSPENLMSGCLNFFISQTIIESLKCETEALTNRSPTSPYSCEGLPIMIESIIREERVLRGKVTSLGKESVVIVKIPRSSEDFVREVSILSDLQGRESHVPDLLRSDQYGVDNKPYFVMRSFGVSLPHLLSRESSNSYRLEIAKEITRAVMWLHFKDLVHCDVKPDNILIEDVGGGLVRAKLCDFDSASRAGSDFPFGVVDGVKMLKFTRSWVSPEVYKYNLSLQSNPKRGGVAAIPRLSTNKSMDIFPLGLVLGCLFSRERSPSMTMLPFEEDKFHEALTIEGKLTSMITCNSLSSDSCRESVASLCALEPANRGKLGDVMDILDGFRLTNLQKENSTLKGQVAVQDQIKVMSEDLLEEVKRVNLNRE